MLEHRPAVLTALALTCGIGVSVGAGLAIPLWILALPLGLAGISAVLRFPRMLTSGLVLSAIALLGAIYSGKEASRFSDTPLARVAAFRLERSLIVGEIADVRESPNGNSVVVEVDSLGKPRERLVPMRGRVLLYLQFPATGLNAGTRLRTFCTIEPFMPPSNPYQFATEIKLQREVAADAQGSVHSRFDCYVTGHSGETLVSRARSSITEARAWTLQVLDSAIYDTNARSFVKAVVLGERSLMPEETLKDFTVAGVSHILAVSGFNVAIIALVIAFLLRLIGVYWLRTRIITTMVGVLAYCLLVGLQPSVVRALFMVELYFLGQLLERRPHPLNILASACCLNLILRPLDLFDAGFQLSYAAVAGLVVIGPQLQRLIQHESTRPRSWQHHLLEVLMLSLAATLASLPVIALTFYRVSVIGLAVNVPVIPLASLVTALGFLLIPLSAASHSVGQLYGEGLEYLTDGLLHVVRLAAHVSGASHAVSPPTAVLTVLYVAGLAYVLRSRQRWQALIRIGVVVVALIVVKTLGVPLQQSTWRNEAQILKVLFFDVGQGDCMLIGTPGGKNYMVDFGTVTLDDRARADRVVAPFLRAEAIERLDAGFISHMHRDHYGGAVSLAGAFAFQRMFTSGERVNDRLAHQLDSVTLREHITRSRLAAGDTLHLDSAVTLYVLHPTRAMERDAQSSGGRHANSGSLVFTLTYGTSRFLFLGDIERTEEESLLQHFGPLLRSSVVKVAHHGSLTSSSHGFVEAVHPGYAVISVGAHNRFGHPAPAIIRRWMSSGATVCRTDKDGAQLFESDGTVIRRVHWR